MAGGPEGETEGGTAEEGRPPVEREFRRRIGKTEEDRPRGRKEARTPDEGRPRLPVAAAAAAAGGGARARGGAGAAPTHQDVSLNDVAGVAPGRFRWPQGARDGRAGLQPVGLLC